MKKILFAAIFCTVFAGCAYRDEPLPDIRGVLAKQTWYMSDKNINGVRYLEDCQLAYEFTFNKDCTGKMYSPSTCLGHDTTYNFDWYLSSDSKVLYIRDMGAHQAIAILRITSYFDDQLTLQGNWNTQSYYTVLTNVRVH